MRIKIEQNKRFTNIWGWFPHIMVKTLQTMCHAYWPETAIFEQRVMQKHFLNMETGMESISYGIYAYYRLQMYTCVFQGPSFFDISFAKNILFICWRCFLLHAVFFPKFSFHECFWKFIEYLEASKNIISYHIKEDPEPDISIAESTRNSSCTCVLSPLAVQTNNIRNQQIMFEVRLVNCLRELWETVGTKVWFRCFLPGSERNGVNCRQNGVNRNKMFFSY